MTLDNEPTSPITRRAVLVAGAGGAGVALLAACSSGGSDSKSADASQPADSDGAAGSGAESSQPASSGGSSAAGGGSDSLTALKDITVGEAKSVKLPNGKPGLVTRTGETTAVCFSAICTHEGCTVKPDGKQLACPCHGSTYEAATGKVTGGPAPTALAKVTVKVVDGNVVAG